MFSRTPVKGERGIFQYDLTKSGGELSPIVEAIGVWGHRWIEAKSSLKNLDVDLLMWDMRRNLNPEPLPPGRNTI